GAPAGSPTARPPATASSWRSGPSPASESPSTGSKPPLATRAASPSASPASAATDRTSPPLMLTPSTRSGPCSVHTADPRSVVVGVGGAAVLPVTADGRLRSRQAALLEEVAADALD